MKNHKSQIGNQKFKLGNIKLLILDVDGVLTDGRLILDGNGNEHKIFHVHDGYGIELVKKSGVKVAFVSNRRSLVVERRAKELGIEDVYQGVTDKAGILKELLAKYDLKEEEVCAVGDDILDLAIMEEVGLPVAVANARPEVKKIAGFITKARGGEGAVREITELIAHAKKKT